MLPFLLSDGVTSPVKDAQAACLTYLHDIVKVAGRLLRPYLPDLVSVSLGSLSSLERGELSYLQLHADAGTGHYGQGISGERLEAARIAATR